MNPIANTAVFVALAGHEDKTVQKKIAFKALIISFFVNSETVSVPSPTFVIAPVSVVDSFKSFPNMIKVYLDSKKMYKKWEINPSDELLDMKLNDLRKAYNITVIN